MIDTGVNSGAAIARLKSLGPKVRARTAAAVAEETGMLFDAVLTSLSGGVLRPATGKLRDSISKEVIASSAGASGRVFSDGSVPYARIQEYGGRISIPQTVPVSAKALAFRFDGKLVFAAHVRAHVVDIPARPYLRPVLAAEAPSFKAGIEAALREALQ